MISLNNRGFALIEVLISALILFAALSLGTLAYRSSIRIIDRVAAIADISDALPEITLAVKRDIMAHRLKGEGRQGRNIQYQWVARVVKTSRDIISSYDEATGGLEYGRFKLSLNEIQLTVSYHGAGINRKEQYRYDELSWMR